MAEVLLALLSDDDFFRRCDALTGYEELVVRQTPKLAGS